MQRYYLCVPSSWPTIDTACKHIQQRLMLLQRCRALRPEPGSTPLTCQYFDEQRSTQLFSPTLSAASLYLCTQGQEA